MRGNEKTYIRNPKGIAQFDDTEDFEQEMRIREWLKCEGMHDEFEFQHITRKGTARDTRIGAHGGFVRLDQKIGDDESSTFADIIAGCDGRDLERGEQLDEPPIDPYDQISGYLLAIGVKQKEIPCLQKILKSSIRQSMWRSEKFQIDLESWKQFEHFSP